MYYYDTHGFLTDTVDLSRSTEVAPPFALEQGMAWNWSGQTWIPVSTAPPEDPPAPRRWITKLGFRKRFIDAERIGINLASIDNPAGSLQARQQAAALRETLKDQEQATYIDLDRSDTRAGVQALESAGLVGVGRAAVILDGPVLEHERYVP